MAMCLSLSATVILSCLFVPKLRVVLLKPDKNVRSKSKSMASSATVKLIVGTHNNPILNNNLKKLPFDSNNATVANPASSSTSETGANDFETKKNLENEKTHVSKEVSDKTLQTIFNDSNNKADHIVLKIENHKNTNTEINCSDFQLPESKLYKKPLLDKIKTANSIPIEKTKKNDDKPSSPTKINQMLIEKEMGELTKDENNNLNCDGELSETTIKQVVDQCFDELSKSNKISGACLNLNMCTKVNEAKAFSQNENIADSIQIANSDDPPNLKTMNTLVEKKLDVLNGPTNTILLSSKNDANDLFSLKITFV
jgi:hypothetical protein